MNNLLRVYEKLIMEVLPQNAHNPELPVPGDGFLIVENKADAANEIKAVNSMLHYLHVHKTNERALNLMAVHNIDKWLRNEYDRNLYRAERNLLLARVLIKKAFIKEGTAILQSTYKVVCKYQHTAYALLYAQELYMRYAMQGRLQKCYNFERYIKQHFDNLKSETTCLQAYYKVISLLANRWDVSNDVVKKAGGLWGIIKKEKVKHATHINNTCFFRVGIYYCQIAGKYEGVIKLAKKFEYYLTRNSHLMQDGRIAEIAHYLVNACLAQKKFKQGVNYVKAYDVYFNRDNINRISFMELYVQLLLHAGKYAQALQLYEEVTATVLFKKAGPVKKETWVLYRAYIDFALRNASMVKSFKTAHFLNFFEKISKDKGGLNFEMLVIAYLYKIVRGSSDDLYAYSIYFAGYVKRNIKRQYYFRSYYFAKMLQLLFKYNFNCVKIEEIGKKFLVRLESNPHSKRKDKKIVEIIPYEKLWQMVINLLRQRKKDL